MFEEFTYTELIEGAWEAIQQFEILLVAGVGIAFAQFFLDWVRDFLEG